MSKTPPPRLLPGTPVVLLKAKPGPKAKVKAKPKVPAKGAPPPPPSYVITPGLIPAGPAPPVLIPGGPLPPPPGYRAPRKQKAKPKGKVKPRTAGLMPCVAVALARVLWLRADQVLPYCRPGGDYIEEVLAALHCDGLAGDYWPAGPDLSLPGQVIGLTIDDITHAAVTDGDGRMRSWGMTMNVHGRIDEAWWALPAEEAFMQSQKSDPLAFGKVYGKVMADRAAGVPPPGVKPLAVQLGLVPDQEQIAETVKGDTDE